MLRAGWYGCWQREGSTLDKCLLIDGVPGGLSCTPGMFFPIMKLPSIVDPLAAA